METDYIKDTDTALVRRKPETTLQTQYAIFDIEIFLVRLMKVPKGSNKYFQMKYFYINSVFIIRIIQPSGDAPRLIFPHIRVLKFRRRGNFPPFFRNPRRRRKFCVFFPIQDRGVYGEVFVRAFIVEIPQQIEPRAIRV